MYSPTRSSLLALGGILFALATVPVQAEVLVFGPEQLGRGKGKPQAITHTFTNPLPTDEFIFRLFNGQEGGPIETRVTSAVVLLNSFPFLGSEHFGEDVEYLENFLRRYSRAKMKSPWRLGAGLRVS